MTEGNGGKSKPLNARQRRFITEYVVDYNANAAAVRAGYSAKDRAVGHKLLANRRVARAVRKHCAIIEQRLELQAGDVHRGLCRIATDPREPSEGGPTWRARIEAYTQIGKILGMYTSKVQLAGSLTLVDLLVAVDQRVEADKRPPTEVH